MITLDASNVAEYLQAENRVSRSETICARELGGGVSNVVLYVERDAADDFVVKQGREQLRVAEPWFCSLERIVREVEVLRICEKMAVADGFASPLRVEVPRVLFEDRENYLYAMTAAPTGHRVWKRDLLDGSARADVAQSCGMFLGRLHAQTWHDAELAVRLEDRQFFDALRLDPYYRHVARVRPELAAALERLIDSVWSERHCLVHGDFSPKNILVYDNGLMIIDFEVGHYGDPAFDLGFFLSHLMLKAFYHAPLEEPFFELIDSFWESYLAAASPALSEREVEGLVARSVLNFAGCVMARLDGKSKVDYLTREDRRGQLRRLCRTIFSSAPGQWEDVAELARAALQS